VIDEAFMDVISPSQSMIDQTSNQHLLVLRSVGKFFGLAGIRLGFVSAAPVWLDAITALSSPWEVNGPAQFIATEALLNQSWQQRQLNDLQDLAKRLEVLLQQHFNRSISGTALFKTVKLEQAPELFDRLCQRGIYVRLCDENDALRFGIPTKQQLNTLAKVLNELNLNA